MNPRIYRHSLIKYYSALASTAEYTNGDIIAHCTSAEAQANETDIKPVGVWVNFTQEAVIAEPPAGDLDDAGSGGGAAVDQVARDAAAAAQADATQALADAKPTWLTTDATTAAGDAPEASDGDLFLFADGSRWRWDGTGVPDATTLTPWSSGDATKADRDGGNLTAGDVASFRSALNITNPITIDNASGPVTPPGTAGHRAELLAKVDNNDFNIDGTTWDDGMWFTVLNASGTDLTGVTVNFPNFAGATLRDGTATDVSGGLDMGPQGTRYLVRIEEEPLTSGNKFANVYALSGSNLQAGRTIHNAGGPVSLIGSTDNLGEAHDTVDGNDFTINATDWEDGQFLALINTQGAESTTQLLPVGFAGAFLRDGNTTDISSGMPIGDQDANYIVSVTENPLASGIKYLNVKPMGGAGSCGMTEVALTPTGDPRVFTTSSDVSGSSSLVQLNQSFLVSPYDYTLVGTALTLDASNPAPGGGDSVRLYSGDATVVPAGGGIPDAPADGDTYGRKDNAWSQISKKVRAKFSTNIDTPLPDSTFTNCPFSTVVDGQASYLNGSGEFVAPKTGAYQMDFRAFYFGTSAASGRYVRTSPLVNGLEIAADYQYRTLGTDSAQAYVTMEWSGVLNLTAGQTVIFRLVNKSGQTLTHNELITHLDVVEVEQ